jgi:hypothetical protein
MNRMNKSWRLAAVLALMAMVIASVWLVQRFRNASRAFVRLADGSTVELESVAFDHEVRIRAGTGWRDYVALALPQKWADKLAQSLTIHGSNTLTVVLTSATPQLPFGGLRGVVVDAHGCEFGLTQLGHPGTRGKQQILIFRSVVFPRGEKTFRFRLYEGRQVDSTWTIAGEFPLRNPRVRSAAPLTPETLPITRKVDGSEFTLLRIQTAVRADTYSPSPPVAGEDIGAILNFRFVPAEAWELARLFTRSGAEISDRFGQRVSRRGFGGTEDGTYRVDFNGLCVEESAWKIDVEFVRAKFFPEGELWRIANIRIPKPGETLSHEVVTNLFGAELKFKEIALPGEKSQSQIGSNGNLVNPSPGSIHRILLECPTLPPGRILKFVGGVDEMGRKIAQRTSSAVGGNYAWGLNIPDYVKTVDVTFAMTKPISLTYYVKPSRFRQIEPVAPTPQPGTEGHWVTNSAADSKLKK